MTPSSPSSSSSLDDDDDDDDDDEGEEGEEENEAAEEEKEPEEEPEELPEEEPEELCDDDDDDEEGKDSDEDTDEDSDKDSSDEDSDKVVVARLVVKLAKYYNPKEMWHGQDHKQRYRSVRNFYSLSEKKVYHDFPLPVPYYKNIRGSSHGWLVTMEEFWSDDNGGGEPYLPVRLFNPFRTNNNEIQLPPFTNGNPGNLDIGERIQSSYFLKKAFLSANPSSLSDPTTQLVVLGVYGQNRLAFCRPGDKSWTRLDLEDYRPITDIICYNDQFYAILQSGYVFAFVLDAAQPYPTPIVTEAFSPPNEVGPRHKGMPTRYLVESQGDLLQVRRNIGLLSQEEYRGYITRQFLVFKLDPIGQWVEIKTLNDHMIFIGDNSSMSISTMDFPRWSSPNSIYYTDDYYEGFNYNPQHGPRDMGVFNLEDGSFERHYEAESNTIMPPPIWIQPML